MTEHWRELLSSKDGCCDLLARLKEAYDEQHDVIEQQQRRIVELETQLGTTVGAMRFPDKDDRAMARFAVDYDIPTNTPR